MPKVCRLLLLILMLCTTLGGCGGRATATSQAQSGACTGLSITGTLVDSLTGQPVPQGILSIESGTVVTGTHVYDFSFGQQATSNSDGSFMLCSPALQSPSVLVIVALDSSRNAYPPFVAGISGAASLGSIQLGSCHGKCGLDGQQQSSAGSTISGFITTDSMTESGSIVPRYALAALDGSSDIWNLGMPNLNILQTSTFTATANACAGIPSFCAPYMFVLPSQKPVVAMQKGYAQQAGAPVYSMYASVAGNACTPSLTLTNFQAGGNTPLVASPGSQRIAATLAFQTCH